MIYLKRRKFGYADDICLATQAISFTEIEHNLSSDLIAMEDYCDRWRLKPSASKTVCSTFHLCNASANQELVLSLKNQRIRHDVNPVYLGVTLDRTLSYKKNI